MMHSRYIHRMFYSLLRTVSLQLLLSLPHCRHQLVSLHPPSGNSAEVLGSGSHWFPLVRGGWRGCACDCGEEEFNSVGGGEGEEDERRSEESKLYQTHSLSEEACRNAYYASPTVVWALKFASVVDNSPRDILVVQPQLSMSASYTRISYNCAHSPFHSSPHSSPSITDTPPHWCTKKFTDL